VVDRSSSSVISSLSLEDSVHVDGSYSCFRGEDDRLRVLKLETVGVKTGVLDALRVTGVAGLGDRCRGTGGGLSSSAAPELSSSIVSGTLFWNLGGADAGGSGISR
jgi:hypothetical protein